MFKRFLAATTKSVTFAALLIGLSSLLSRLIGIFRDRLLSGTFGAGRDLDVYYAAFRIPDLVHGIVVGGVVTAGFIPVFTHYLGKHASPEKGVGEEAGKLADALISALGVALSIGGLAAIVFAPQIVPHLAPGFSVADTERAVMLTRIMTVSTCFLGFSNVFGGILQTKRRFAIYSMAPILYNVGIIIGTVTLAPRFGIVGPAMGVVLGAGMHLFSQIWASSGAGYSFHLSTNFGHEGLKQIVKQTLPRLASIGAANVNALIMTSIASTLGAGSIAIYTLSNNLQMFPTMIVGTSFAIAAFPVISDLASKGKHDEFALSVSRTTRNILFLIIPATVLMLLLRAQIVRVVLGSGRFDWADTIATADTLAFFSLSLFSQALWPLFARACFAMEDALAPLWSVLAGIVVERATAAYLVSRGMEIPALALAFSFGSIVTISWLWVSLRNLVKRPLGEAAIVKSVALTSVAAVLMALAVQGSKILLAGVVDMQTFWGIATQGIGSGAAGIAVFVSAAYVMGSEEAKAVVAVYTRRFAPTPVAELHQEDGSLGA